MLRKRRQVDDRAVTSVTELQDRNTCTTSSVARSSNNMVSVIVRIWMSAPFWLKVEWSVLHDT